MLFKGLSRDCIRGFPTLNPLCSHVLLILAKRQLVHKRMQS